MSPKSVVITAAIWLAGSAIVTVSQPGTARKEAALGAAAAGIALIGVTAWLTKDGGRRYFRSLLAGMVAVSLTSTYLLRHLTGTTKAFAISGLDTRIALPLMFLLFLPLVAGALPRDVWRPRALWELRRQARAMDWVALAYALLIVPGLLLGVAHHAPKTFIAQDLGLVVFFVFMYVAGRAVTAATAAPSAQELMEVLLAVAVMQYVLFYWTPAPLYTFAEAASAAALAVAILRPGRAGLLAGVVGATILVDDASAIHSGSNSSTGILLIGALAVLAYLVIRIRPVLPRWLIVAGAVAALVVFVGFTSDGRTLRGQDYGAKDPSNIGRTFEAQQVLKEVKRTPLSVVFGRGFGGTIDERNGPPLFTIGLEHGGRDLAHVQQVHLLEYNFLLKLGLVGAAWLVAFVLALAVLVLQGLEWAARRRDPTPAIYAALPLLGLAVAFAAATRLQVNPLNAFALGVLVTYLGARPADDRS